MYNALVMNRPRGAGQRQGRFALPIRICLAQSLSRRESEALSPTSGGMPTPRRADAGGRPRRLCKALSAYRYRPTAATDPGLDPATTGEGDRGVSAPFKPIAHLGSPAPLPSPTETEPPPRAPAA